MLTASLKSLLLTLNDRSRDSGVRIERPRPAKSKVSLHHFGGLLEIPSNVGCWPEVGLRFWP